MIKMNNFSVFKYLYTIIQFLCIVSLFFYTPKLDSLTCFSSNLILEFVVSDLPILTHVPITSTIFLFHITLLYHLIRLENLALLTLHYTINQDYQYWYLELIFYQLYQIALMTKSFQSLH